MNVVSLFSNIGVAEAYLAEIGFNVVVANEIDEKRANIYKAIYPKTEMVIGDITQSKVQDRIVALSARKNAEVLIATPPCQGMSTAGKMDEKDIRNNLIFYAIEVAKKIYPKYIFFENVPMQLLTKIMVKGIEMLIPDYIKQELGEDYLIEYKVINTADYSVPQSRDRAVFLITRKDMKKVWAFPSPSKEQVTLEDAIGHLPTLDPLVYDVDYTEQLQMFPEYESRKSIAEKISKWHTPPKHVKRQVIVMQHTRTGESAFNNEEKYLPRKKDGSLIKGFANTYKRQAWDLPAYTITMYNRTISSQNNVHPGRKLPDGTYSDPRVLTTYELMLCMSLPLNWPVPMSVSETYLRSIIGEGIPPLFVKKLFEELI